MKKWIRWKGLAAFVVAVAVVVLLWVLVVDSLVRKAIETVGTRAVGARVDLAKADLSLMPLGLDLGGLAVTNPDAPMQNIVEIDHMQMDLNPAYLIRRKVIANNLIVEGLRFNTPRRTSGEVPQSDSREKEAKIEKEEGVSGLSKAALQKVCGEFSMPSFSKPDINAILSAESLDSMALVTELQTRLKDEQAQWENKLAQLPDEKKLKDYQARLDKIKKSGGSLGAILGSVGDVQKLQEDIQKDLDLIKNAQNSFNADYRGYQQQVNALADAPRKDINRLMDKYSISAKGLGNLSQLIFGEKLCGWVQTAWQWYHKLEPYLGKVRRGKDGKAEAQTPLRGRGQNIHFAETPPMPDFLIRHTKVNAQLAAGDLTGKVENITSDQSVLGQPMTYYFLGKQMKRMASLSLTGKADYVNPQQAENTALMTIKDLSMTDLTLVQQPDFPLTLKKAAANLVLNLDLNADRLNATVKGDFSGVQFNADPAGDKSDLAGILRSALSGVKQFALTAAVEGTPGAYTINIGSDLDKVLQSAAGHLVSAEAAKLETAIKQRIDAMLKGPLAQTRSELANLDNIQAELKKRSNLGDDLLKKIKISL